MAGMIFSTYTMFLPQHMAVACAIILCIGVFGIYIPWQEHKKKRKQKPKSPPSPHPASGKKRMEQLNALKKAGILTEEEYQAKKRGLR